MNALVLAFHLWAGAETVVLDKRYAASLSVGTAAERAEIRNAILYSFHPLLMTQFLRDLEENRQLEQWLERQGQERRTLPNK